MTRTHDFVGIGLGPFNLGLACLTEPLRESGELDGVFLEARDRFAWHPGMLLDDATLQVPFLADLVTMADPTSRWSFLNYLKESGHLYPFYIRESFYPLRREYDDYCRWAAERLPSIRFGRRVERVEHDGAAYVVTTSRGEVFRARRLVVGIGTSPRVPECLRPLLDAAPGDRPAVALHSADYLAHRERLQRLGSVTVVGSGQSAAEVYHDLLAASPDHGYRLTWLTRSPRFFPMEYTKLTLEMTSPEYGAYHRRLPLETRERLAREQRHLYKGISGDLVDAISDLHYRLRVSGDGPRTTLVTNTSVVGGRWDGSAYDLDLHHDETGEAFGLRTEGLVLATGYAPTVPAFLEPVRTRIRHDPRGRYDVAADYSVDLAGGEVFVQNAEEHTHSLLAPDLGMGAYRNSVIIAAMTGREVYPVEKRIAVQTFGVPEHLRRTDPAVVGR
ncbi:SidA/IucD/PvdA family monooxygenase [Nocardioides sp. TF02-7]|uniref:lysine N(6)-hydroxylase/L-ornithine N(5)-oxygenase family protein n=1 Tax=Nocardioides sp. TF02-7 TaxID=2917724 RepID=UPI001F05FFEF|nr:SidA/IucD/PvdA family monooxygenase [Nocardioides sp. TF02-7]UMG93805.1 SidA/IucD/PvdA family monooxygenase [Nocardioides sp. TF02-7]